MLGFMNPDQPIDGSEPESGYTSGKTLRRNVPRNCHVGWEAQAGRDPIGILLAQEQSRVPELLPIREAPEIRSHELCFPLRPHPLKGYTSTFRRLPVSNEAATTPRTEGLATGRAAGRDS